jgi:DNA-binding MarR family transcriptional regulator
VHPTFFSVKRAFHGILRIFRRPLASFGLTPARFDLLYVLYERLGHRALQSEIRGALGVTAATVSRMLASLEALGLVAREHCASDRRTRLVLLTYEGMDRMEAAFRALVADGAAQLALDCALAFPRQHDRRACRSAMQVFDRLLLAMRDQFGDTAWFPYRKWPDCILVFAPHTGPFRNLASRYLPNRSKAAPQPRTKA